MTYPEQKLNQPPKAERPSPSGGTRSESLARSMSLIKLEGLACFPAQPSGPCQTAHSLGRGVNLKQREISAYKNSSQPRISQCFSPDIVSNSPTDHISSLSQRERVSTHSQESSTTASGILPASRRPFLQFSLFHFCLVSSLHSFGTTRQLLWS